MKINDRLRRRNARRQQRIEHLTSELALAEEDADCARGELEDAVSWPKWADQCLKIIRKHSGYDGYDDAYEGVDLPSELEDTLGEYRQQARRKAVEARVEHETKRHRDAAAHSWEKVKSLCVEITDVRRHERDALAMILFMGMCAGDRLALAQDRGGERG